eukprot:COSAG06_NODE_1126_length_10609_cov_228.247383_11_plen_84_part_00
MMISEFATHLVFVSVEWNIPLFSQPAERTATTLAKSQAGLAAVARTELLPLVWRTPRATADRRPGGPAPSSLHRRHGRCPTAS